MKDEVIASILGLSRAKITVLVFLPVSQTTTPEV